MSASEPTSVAAVLHGAKDLRIETRPLPAPGPGEVQISILSTGLCGSDLHYYSHGRNGAFAVRHPYVLGHESGGKVVAVGEGVEGFEVGQGVAVECGVMCGRCERCKEGRYNLCPKMEFKSSAKMFPHADGTLREALNHPANLVHPRRDIPPRRPSRTSLRRPPRPQAHLPLPGCTVLIYGAGAVGLLAATLFRHLGASQVCIVDIDAARVDLAVKEGWAHQGWGLPRGERAKTPEEGLVKSEETARAIGEKFGVVGGFDVTMECTGVEPCIQAGIYSTRPGGKLALIGMGTPNVLLPLSAAALREVDIVGVFRYSNTYPTALALLASTTGPLSNIDRIVTHRVPLKEANKAFELMANGKDENGGMVVKVMVES